MPPPTLPSSTGPSAAASSAAARVLGADVEPVHVVEDAVPCLGDNRQAPGAAVACERGRHERFVDCADGMRVGQRDRRGQQPRLLHPLEARDFAVAVEPERRRERGEVARDDDRDAGPHVVAFDECCMPDADAGDVGDRVQQARLEVADDDAEVSSPHERITSSTSSRFRSISSCVRASRFSLSSGSVLDGLTLKCQSSASTEMPSRWET